MRNWFTFSACERWREDDNEHEHYSDSGGKSGGQKEKLAYTILAASLAYQFGLEWGAVRSRSFRFVVIDEAFGRGSDESAHYGLRLFDTEPATADRHPACRRSTSSSRSWPTSVCPQRRGRRLQTAQPDHRGIPRGKGAKRGIVGPLA